MSGIDVGDSVAGTRRADVQGAQTVLDTCVHLALEVCGAVRRPGGRVAATAEGAELAGFGAGGRCRDNSRGERDRGAKQ